jgi:hypothetical protein
VSDPRSACAEALARAADDLDDALSHIRAETTAGRVTPAEAAKERAGLLERHLRRISSIRADYAERPVPRKDNSPWLP